MKKVKVIVGVRKRKENKISKQGNYKIEKDPDFQIFTIKPIKPKKHFIKRRRMPALVVSIIAILAVTCITACTATSKEEVAEQPQPQPEIKIEVEKEKAEPTVVVTQPNSEINDMAANETSDESENQKDNSNIDTSVSEEEIVAEENATQLTEEDITKWLDEIAQSDMEHATVAIWNFENGTKEISNNDYTLLENDHVALVFPKDFEIDSYSIDSAMNISVDAQSNIAYLTFGDMKPGSNSNIFKFTSKDGRNMNAIQVFIVE